MTNTYFKVADAEALAVLIRYAAVCGQTTSVAPINDYFVVKSSCVINKLDVNSEINFKPFTNGVDRERTYWQEIVEVDESAVEFLNIYLP